MTGSELAASAHAPRDNPARLAAAAHAPCAPTRQAAANTGQARTKNSRTAGLDANALLLVGGLVLGAHVHDAVGVNVKRHLCGACA
jgi:hypothetical protein